LLLAAGSNRDRRSRPTVRRPQLATHAVKPRNTSPYPSRTLPPKTSGREPIRIPSTGPGRHAELAVFWLADQVSGGWWS